MQQKLFALSLGFGGLILAAHHAFASVPAVSGAQAGVQAGVQGGIVLEAVVHRGGS